MGIQNVKYFPHDFQSKYNILLIPYNFQETKFLITVHWERKPLLFLLLSWPFSPAPGTDQRC